MTDSYIVKIQIHKDTFLINLKYIIEKFRVKINKQYALYIKSMCTPISERL